MRLISDSFRIIGRPFLARAYELALEGGARTASPNPMVGCVVVSKGVVVGEGYHERAGGPHAEIVALEHAGEQAKGATVYVTLEPCNHTGKTGPCTQALIEAQVKRVVIGVPDPNPKARGGAKVLSEAGIDVEFVADPRPFEELTRGWAKRLRTGKPYVRVKLGTSLDAAISIRRDAQTSITGASGAEVTHRLRKYADGILISASTAIADNPSLTLRGINGELLENQPKRYILVRAHVPPRDLTVFTDGAAETVILCPDSFDENTFEGYDARVVFYPTSGGLNAALEAIGTLGANTILIEPGQRLFTEIINGRILDELVTVTAGGFLGADSLKSYDGIATIEGSESPLRVMEHRLVPFDTAIYGDVVATMWRPRGQREK